MQLLPVAPFQETLHASMCGPASLKMVLSYYGIEKSEAELAEVTGSSGELGTDDASIAKAVTSLGLTVEIQNESSFEDIDVWLKKGVPVIVDWFTRGRQDYEDSAVADGHY